MSRGRGQGTGAESGLRTERTSMKLAKQWGASFNDIERVRAMKGLIILAGVPGAGKSTFVRNNLPDAVVISTDAYRAKAPNSAGDWDQSASRWAFVHAFEDTKKALAEGQVVVFDSVAVGERARNDLRKLAPAGTDVNYVLMGAPAEQAKLFNRFRGVNDPMREIPEDVIDRFHNTLIEDADKLKPADYTHVAIIDIEDAVILPSAPSFRPEDRTALLDILDRGPAALDAAAESGQLATTFPELAATIGYDQHNKYHDLTLYEHIREVFGHAHKRGDEVLMWTALVHDLGKPESRWFGPDGQAHYYRPWKPEKNHPGRGKESHEVISARMAPAILQRYGLDPQAIREATFLSREHMFAEPRDVKGMKKLLGRMNGNAELTEKLISFRECDHGGKGDGREYNADHLRKLLKDAQKPEPKKVKLAIGGKELMEHGLSGYHIGEAIKKLTKDVQEGRVANDAAALRERLRSIT